MILFVFLFHLAFNIISSQSPFLQDPLLKMGDNSQCIKEVIDTFIKKQTCQKLSESHKTLLAIKMTNCLNLKVGKQMIPQCNDLKKCKIQGDDWNSFTTFFTHIDNLCHFYWDLLHHQRTESLIDGLSGSAILAQGILQQNFKSSEKILVAQQSIQTYMEESLSSNKKLSETLSNSELKLQNMTKNIETFLNQLNYNIISQYSSIVKTMETINQGIDGLNTVQGFMISQINTMSGILYFLLQILMLIVLTSFRCFRKYRMNSFVFFMLNIMIEIILPDAILLFLGIKTVRIIFVISHIFNLAKAFLTRQDSFEEMKSYMEGRLDTKRIKRIFKEMIDEQKEINQQKASIKQN